MPWTTSMRSPKVDLSLPNLLPIAMSIVNRSCAWWSSYLSGHELTQREETCEDDFGCGWLSHSIGYQWAFLHHLSTHRCRSRTAPRWDLSLFNGTFHAHLRCSTGLRLHFPQLVKGLTEQNQNKAQLGLGHAYSRAKVKFNVNRVDNMIIQSIALLDQLDKDINTFSMRIR